jgi:hypothetical protein
MMKTTTTPIPFGADPLMISIVIEGYAALQFSDIPAPVCDLVKEGITDKLFNSQLVDSVKRHDLSISCDCVFPILVSEENISEQAKQIVRKNTVAYMQSLGYLVNQSSVRIGRNGDGWGTVTKISDPLDICSKLHKNIAVFF